MVGMGSQHLSLSDRWLSARSWLTVATHCQICSFTARVSWQHGGGAWIVTSSTPLPPGGTILWSMACPKPKRNLQCCPIFTINPPTFLNSRTIPQEKKRYKIWALHTPWCKEMTSQTAPMWGSNLGLQCDYWPHRPLSQYPRSCVFVFPISHIP